MKTPKILVLNKGTVLIAKILGVFIAHLRVHTGKVLLKRVTLSEHMVRLLNRPYRVTIPRE